MTGDRATVHSFSEVNGHFFYRSQNDQHIGTIISAKRALAQSLSITALAPADGYLHE